MQRRSAFVLSLLALTASGFAQTMGDPVATLTVTNAIGNHAEYFGMNDNNVFHYGVTAYTGTVYTTPGYPFIDRMVSGSSNAKWRVTRTSTVNPGALSVVLKPKTKCHVQATGNSHYGNKTWFGRSFVMGLWGTPSSFLAELQGQVLPYTPHTAMDEEKTVGYPSYQAMSDIPIQLSASNWARVGTTNTWEAFVEFPAQVIAIAQAEANADNYQTRMVVFYEGATRVEITFPGFG